MPLDLSKTTKTVILKARVTKKNTIKAAAVPNQALERCMRLPENHNANLDLSLSGQLQPASIDSCSLRPIYVSSADAHSEASGARLSSAHVDHASQLILADGVGCVDVVQTAKLCQLPDHDSEDFGYSSPALLSKALFLSRSKPFIHVPSKTP